KKQPPLNPIPVGTWKVRALEKEVGKVEGASSSSRAEEKLKKQKNQFNGFTTTTTRSKQLGSVYCTVHSFRAHQNDRTHKAKRNPKHTVPLPLSLTPHPRYFPSLSNFHSHFPSSSSPFF
ncbi:hypothetical protein TorRG33x02_121650, partial [Trema orientale]